MGAWWMILIAFAAVMGAFALGAATRGRARRHESRRPEGQERKGRELSPREKLARDGGMASFGLNLPWWTRTDSGRRHAGGRRRT